MNPKVICLRPSATLRSAAGTLRSHHISGAPVTDEKGKLLGVLSERDIAEAVVPYGALANPRRWLDEVLGRAPLHPEETLALLRERMARLRVEDVMTTDVVAIEPTTSQAEAVERMETRGLHRLPVLRNGRLIGIVARSDLR